MKRSLELRLGPDLSLRLASPQQRAAARYVAHEIFTCRRYARPGFEIRPTDTVVDIGANMGVFVLWAALQASAGRVLAIEPTSALDVLTMNVERNGLGNVIAVRAAAGRDGDAIDITTYPGFNIVSHSSAWKPKLWTRALIMLRYGYCQSAPVVERATTRSLKGLLEDHRIARVDYLKCDCEGGEYEIFRNLDSETLARIDRIAMEFHEYAPDQHGAQLIDILQRHGFTVEVEKNPFEYRFMKYGMLWARRRDASRAV